MELGLVFSAIIATVVIVAIVVVVLVQNLLGVGRDELTDVGIIETRFIESVVECFQKGFLGLDFLLCGLR